MDQAMWNEGLGRGKPESVERVKKKTELWTGFITSGQISKWKGKHFKPDCLYFLSRMCPHWRKLMILQWNRISDAEKNDAERIKIAYLLSPLWLYVCLYSLKDKHRRIVRKDSKIWYELKCGELNVLTASIHHVPYIFNQTQIERYSGQAISYHKWINK